MRATIWIAAAFLLSSCAPAISTRYSGNDAGYAVIGVGAASTTEYSSYTFLFRRAGKKDTGRFTYFQHNIFSSRKPDYSNERNQESLKSQRFLQACTNWSISIFSATV